MAAPMTRQDAERRSLQHWREWQENRDERIINAFLAGISILEIAEITGLSRTTIYRVLYESGTLTRREQLA